MAGKRDVCSQYGCGGKLYLRAGRQDRGIARGCVFTDEGKRPARKYDVASSPRL